MCAMCVQCVGSMEFRVNFVYVMHGSVFLHVLVCLCV